MTPFVRSKNVRRRRRDTMMVMQIITGRNQRRCHTSKLGYSQSETKLIMAHTTCSLDRMGRNVPHHCFTLVKSAPSVDASQTGWRNPYMSRPAWRNSAACAVPSSGVMYANRLPVRMYARRIKSRRVRWVDRAVRKKAARMEIWRVSFQRRGPCKVAHRVGTVTIRYAV